MKKHFINLDRQKRREELLRPSRYLGYDHDAVGTHLYIVESYRIAEAELRRAVWLNPYEVNFKIHLAWRLCRLEKMQEAEDLARKVLKEDPSNQEARQILDYIEENRDG
jgi:tetratricopeptide (TPR) repeat protein